MKRLAFLSIPLLLLASCGGKDTHERVQHLDKVSGEWTKEQTDEAIDLYIDGLHRQEALLEQNMGMLEQTGFFRRSKCHQGTLDERSSEIEKAEKRLDERRASLIEEYSAGK